jgi:hypothetical protein
MLRPINGLPYLPALEASHALLCQLIQWLCEPARASGDITEANIKAMHRAEAVGNWLVWFMGRSRRTRKLSKCAGILADLPLAEKAAVHDWIGVVPNVRGQFGDGASAWPAAHPCAGESWEALRALTEAFYEIGLEEGLPFDEAGNPVASGGLTRKGLVKQFKDTVSSQTCIFCDGPLGSPEVDHWLAKKVFPCLAVAPDNLVLACHACNSREHKGEKPTWTVGAAAPFADWFHPFYLPIGDRAAPLYRDGKVELTAATPAHAPHVANLEGLLHLSERWTVEFRNQVQWTQGRLRGKVRRGRLALTEAALRDQLEEYVREIEDEGDAPNRLIRNLVMRSALEPTRLQDWLDELDD